MQENDLEKQVFDMYGYLPTFFTTTEKNMRELFSIPEIYSFKKIIITGSGDSFSAALSAGDALRLYSGCSVDVVSPLDVSRYMPSDKFGNMPLNPLVIAISNSGKSARTVEAVQRATRLGAFTLAVTGNSDSPLAESCCRTFKMELPSYPGCPGVAGYLGAFIFLCLVAIRFGEVRLSYTMEEANKLRNSLRDSIIKMGTLAGNYKTKMLDYAKCFEKINGVEIIAQWLDAGAALFLQQKFYEAAGLPSVIGDSENWFHANKFLRNFKSTLTIIFMHKDDPGKSRIEEVVQRMDYMGRSYLLITDDDGISGAGVINVPYAEIGIFSALCFIPAPVLFVSYVTELLGEEYNRGFKFPWCDAKGIASTISSHFENID